MGGVKLEQDMSALERALDWLRPLVESKGWDYCVVWKLGDDPSRFFEWGGCCCGGGSNYVNIKEENGGGKHLPPLCRDAHKPHPVRTKACQALVHFPCTMPLYSGIHGEAVISSQHKWLNHTHSLDSKLPNESTGTLVLIPLVGGLIELYSSKQIYRDQKLIELIMTQFNISVEEEIMKFKSTSNMNPYGHLLDSTCKMYLNNCPTQFQNHIPRLQCSTYTNIQGTSPCSSLSSELPSCNSEVDHATENLSLDLSVGKDLWSKPAKYIEYDAAKKANGIVSDHCNPVIREESLKTNSQNSEGEHYKSKNLITERKRRTRIREGLFTLRSLVPNITKMDRTAILGDAIDYIKELQLKVQELQDELRKLEEEDCKGKDVKLLIPKSGKLEESNTSVAKQNQCNTTVDEKKHVEDQLIEIYQIGESGFLLKLLCTQKRGWLLELMEVLNGLGLQVLDANMTTLDGKVLTILMVESHTSEVDQVKSLTDMLTAHITRCLGQQA